MLSISTEPQSQPTEEANAATEDTKTAAENGTQPVMGGDKDEIMSKILLIYPPSSGMKLFQRIVRCRMLLLTFLIEKGIWTNKKEQLLSINGSNNR